MRNLSAIVATQLVVTLVLIGCKSPRPPYQAAEGDISGEWTAESVATTRPQPAGEILWRLILDQRDAGKIEGSGSLDRAGTPESFSVNGIRGEGVINFSLHMEGGEEAKFDGSVMDVRTMVGQVDLMGDTIPVTFTRPE